MAKVELDTKAKVIDGDKLPSNSIFNNQKEKEEKRSKKESSEESPKEKKVEQVASGKKKKRSIARKFQDVFLDGESTDSVKDYVIFDVIVPALKNTISEVVTTSIEMILFGETGRHRNNRTRREGGRSYVSYSSYYRDRERDSRSSRTRRSEPSSRRYRHDYDDIVLDKRSEAEDVLSHLVDIIDIYEQASVADLYDLVGISSEFTDNRYGWDDLSDASVKRVREGYLLDLPRTIVLD